MATTKYRFVFWLCALGLVHVQAQTGNVGSPATIGAPLGSIQHADNTIVAGTTAAASYDDNALNTRPGVQDVLSTAYAMVGVNVTRARWLSTVTWISGFSYSSANLPSYDFSSQGVGATWTYRGSQRFTLDLSNSFSYSTNPFDALRSTAVLPQFGILNTPTYITWNYIPQTIEAAGATATYAVSQRTAAYIDCSYEYLGYRNLQGLPGTAPSLHSQIGGAVVGISRQMSPRYTAGIQYSVQLLDYDGGQVRTTAHSLEYVVKVTLRHNVSISGLIGPQFLSNTRNGFDVIPGVSFQQTNRRSWAAGATIDWTGQRNGLGAGVLRQVNTGVGYQGNLQQLVANLQFHREFAKRWSVYLFGNYTKNQPLLLSNIVSTSASSYLSAGAGFTRSLTNQITLGATYWIVRQGGANEDPLYSGNHDRFTFSLSYQLTRPLRRS